MSLDTVRASQWVTGRGPALRVGSLDRVRGLAVLCMVVDHACLIFGGPELLRVTVGRVAMPLFFVLAGFLVSRWGRRWHAIAAAGIVLPWFVPWVDSPNVLLWLSVGALLVVLAGDSVALLLTVAAVSLAVAANGWTVGLPGWRSYDPLALLGLMCAGRVLRVTVGWSAFGWGDRLPSLLAWPGRFPLSLYVGHLLVLQGVVALGFWRV